MDRKSKILLIFVGILIALSVSATFYKTVILQDFDITGVWIEFPTEESSYVWFVYDNGEYEIELETTDYDELIQAVSEEVGIEAENLETDFLDYFYSAYEEAEVVEEDEGTDGYEDIVDDEEEIIDGPDMEETDISDDNPTEEEMVAPESYEEVVQEEPETDVINEEEMTEI